MDRRAITDNPVRVEYTSRGQRVVKELPNALAARRFYAQQLKAGRAPKVVK